MIQKQFAVLGGGGRIVGPKKEVYPGIIPGRWLAFREGSLCTHSRGPQVPDSDLKETGGHASGTYISDPRDL